MNNEIKYYLTIIIFILFLIIAGIKIYGFDFIIVQDGKIIVTRRDIDKACENYRCSAITQGITFQIWEEKGYSFLLGKRKVINYFKRVPWKFPIPKETKDDIDPEIPIKIYYWGIFSYEGKINGKLCNYVRSLSEKTSYLSTEIFITSKSSKLIKYKEERLKNRLYNICHGD